jgi:hypothetical protein
MQTIRASSSAPELCQAIASASPFWQTPAEAAAIPAHGSASNGWPKYKIFAICYCFYMLYHNIIHICKQQFNKIKLFNQINNNIQQNSNIAIE